MDSQSDETYEKIKSDLIKENNYLRKTKETMQKKIEFLVLELDRRDKLIKQFVLSEKNDE